jgi:hypothetical protein
MAGRGMGAATQGGGCVTKGPRNRMLKATSKTTGPILMRDGGDVNAYEILGRRVSKEQYEKSAKEMDESKTESEREMDDFAKRSRERARKMGQGMMGGVGASPVRKKKGGMINAHKKMAMGKKKR